MQSNPDCLGKKATMPKAQLIFSAGETAFVLKALSPSVCMEEERVFMRRAGSTKVVTPLYYCGAGVSFMVILIKWKYGLHIKY